MTEQPESNLRLQFRTLVDEAEQFFNQAQKECSEGKDSSFFYSGTYDTNHFWKVLSDETKSISIGLVDRLLSCCATLAQLARTSPLTGIEDVQEVKEAAKAMRAALRLRLYYFHQAEAVHDEGVVIGFRPAGQSEPESANPFKASEVFYENVSKIAAVLKLVEASGTTEPFQTQTLLDSASKYRSGTGFIMMWMDRQQPELTDVADTVRNVFKSFNIRAVRADDIEHEGQISERVLNEIRSSEFLFADLTGNRPNVYYEVGFAHAMGKRVILFRKSGTAIHFDLAGYNCPDYENLRDLREKLVKRLIILTNRNPSEVPEI